MASVAVGPKRKSCASCATLVTARMPLWAQGCGWWPSPPLSPTSLDQAASRFGNGVRQLGLGRRLSSRSVWRARRRRLSSSRSSTFWRIIITPSRLPLATWHAFTTVFPLVTRGRYIVDDEDAKGEYYNVRGRGVLWRAVACCGVLWLAVACCGVLWVAEACFAFALACF